ncbi:MAG: ABC transporter substrate-binding protein [Ruminococcaceae bacterium]|nr:ABC transporter substrate-binding protein [Oscillospiraceae bacterium]
MIKRLLTVILTVAVLTMNTGCMKKASSGEVYFLNFKPEVASVYDEIAKVYKNETGKDVKIVTAASGTYEQTLKSEIAKSSAPTIFQVNGPIGFASWEKYCADLKDTALYNNLNDKDVAITKGDGVYAIPYAIEGYGIIYNDAIMRKYFSLPNKSTSLTDASQIDSFEKLKEIVVDMQSKKKELGIEGVFASTSLNAGEQWRWQTHLANIPFYYEFKENLKEDETTVTKGLDKKEITFKFADNFKNIFDLYINNSVTDKKLLGSKSTSDSMAEFALGKCAMVQNGDWAWSQIKNVDGNVVKENDIKFLPIFTGIEGEENQGLCVGTENYIAVNKNASDEAKKNSIDFLEWLYTSETGKEYVSKRLGFNAPFKSFSENERPDDPLSREVIKWLDSDKNNIEWTFLSFPSDEFKNYFGDVLLQYTQGNLNWNDVKKTVVERWKSESNK